MSEIPMETDVVVVGSGASGLAAALEAGITRLFRVGGAHAPDEWLLIDSSDPKVAGFQKQAEMFVDYLYEVASTARQH